jgi:hypothetical protein
MMPLLVLVGFLEGLLPRPWHLIGVGMAAVFWTLTLVLAGLIELGDRDAVAGATALAFVNALVGMAVALWLKRLVRLVVQAV